MAINSDHLTGFVAGMGSAAVALYLYKQNQQRVDAWLRQQGINVPQASVQTKDAMSLQDLVREKEHLEDLIAERELQVRQHAAPQPAAAT